VLHGRPDPLTDGDGDLLLNFGNHLTSTEQLKLET